MSIWEYLYYKMENQLICFETSQKSYLKHELNTSGSNIFYEQRLSLFHD